MEFLAVKFDYAGEALQHVEASGRGVAIVWEGQHLVADEADVERLALSGHEFAYLVDHELPSGEYRIMTVPVND